MDGCMDGWMYACMYVCITLPMCTVEGSSTKRVLTLPPYSPTVGVHSVRQLHVGASRLSLVFVSDASGEGITCSCVAPCTLCTSCALGYGRTCLRPRSPCSRSSGGYTVTDSKEIDCNQSQKRLLVISLPPSLLTSSPPGLRLPNIKLAQNSPRSHRHTPRIHVPLNQTKCFFIVADGTGLRA